MDVSKIITWVEEHKKFLVALAAAVTVAIAVSTDDKTIDAADVVAIVSAFLGAGAVERVSNKRSKR